MLSVIANTSLLYGVQIITRRGRKTVVVLPFDEYERLVKPVDRLAKFLLDSPLLGSELTIDRDKCPPRDIEIEPWTI